MKHIFSCPFKIEKSHKIASVGFEGGNEVSLQCPIKVENPLGQTNTTLNITFNTNNEYEFLVESLSLHTEESQISFIQEVSEFISFHFGQHEHNAHYGTHFIKIDWFNFRNHQQGISSALDISSSWELKRSFLNWDCTYNDLLRFYFDGLKAEYDKSKYFHWFLILEKLENSEKYKRMFNCQGLFSDKEKQAIRSVADTMDSSVKKSALLNILGRTEKQRSLKLLEILSEIGISKYKYLMEEKDITEETIKNLTRGRNALFHTGSTIETGTLYFQLFPIATQVINALLENPNCLD